MFSLIRLSDTVDHKGDPVELYIEAPSLVILIKSVFVEIVDKGDDVVDIILKSPL